MANSIEKAAGLEVDEAFTYLGERYKKFSLLDSEILDPELRSKTATVLKNEIFQGTTRLVGALQNVKAISQATAPEKHIYSRAEIRQLCKDPETYAQHRDEIHAAMYEGRIEKE